MATPTYCDERRSSRGTGSPRRTRRGHADSLRLLRVGHLSRHRLGAHGVATPTHCDGIIPLSPPFTAMAHTAWPRRLIATKKLRGILPFVTRAHTAWPRQLIATLGPRHCMALRHGRTRRGHANSLRQATAGLDNYSVKGAHGVATPTHCDMNGCTYGSPPHAAHTAWPRQLIATSAARASSKFPQGRTRRGHADLLRHGSCVLPRANRSAHTAWPRRLIATLCAANGRSSAPRRTRRGHADSLRPGKGL